MMPYIGHAEGAPCPTLVLDRRLLPDDEVGLAATLAALRGTLPAEIMKVALISPSPHPLFDLDYRFAQCLTADWSRLDLRGSCGHSMLVAITAAARLGWVPLFPGARVRVNVVNTGDLLVAEVDELSQRAAGFTVHILASPPRPVAEVLPLGAPVTALDTPLGTIQASLVSWANPYVVVDAAELGVPDRAALFADDPTLLEALRTVQAAAAELLGLPPGGAFPKVAAVGCYRPGEVSVRAVTVPSWHPSLGLTGAFCLAVASAVDHTVLAELGRRAGLPPGEAVFDTPAGVIRARAAVTGGTPGDHVRWTSVAGKLVRFSDARAALVAAGR